MQVRFEFKTSKNYKQKLQAKIASKIWIQNKANNEATKPKSKSYFFSFYFFDRNQPMTQPSAGKKANLWGKNGKYLLFSSASQTTSSRFLFFREGLSRGLQSRVDFTKNEFAPDDQSPLSTKKTFGTNFTVGIVSMGLWSNFGQVLTRGKICELQNDLAKVTFSCGHRSVTISPRDFKIGGKTVHYTWFHTAALKISKTFRKKSYSRNWVFFIIIYVFSKFVKILTPERVNLSLSYFAEVFIR